MIRTARTSHAMNLRSISISLMTLVAALAVRGLQGCPWEAGSRGGQRPDQVLNFVSVQAELRRLPRGRREERRGDLAGESGLSSRSRNRHRSRRQRRTVFQGTLMPAFAESQGGMLTDQQIAVLAQGVESRWGKADALGGQISAGLCKQFSPAIRRRGRRLSAPSARVVTAADGTGLKRNQLHTGSLVDPAYLALISNQGLRSLIIAGQPEEGMPDWRSDMTGAGSRAMTDKEITDVVAWLASHRVAAPGQPYTHP